MTEPTIQYPGRIEETFLPTPPVSPLGLGRLPAPDVRDRGFQLRAMIDTATPLEQLPDFKYWNPSQFYSDQGETPHCVAHSWLHFIEDGPITFPGKGPAFDTRTFYCRAQELDEWDGDCKRVRYHGTSVRAGAKVLQEMGFITEYRWAWDVETLARTVLTTGPVVVGTNWYREMFYPDGFGVIHPGGALDGGHAYVINGVNMRTAMFRMKNSWGRGWGQNGQAWISFRSMAKLIAEQGEICLPVEVFHGHK